MSHSLIITQKAMESNCAVYNLGRFM